MESSQPTINENANIILHVTPQDLENNNLSIVELITLAGLYHKDFRNYVDISTFETLESKNFIEGPNFQKKLTLKGRLLLRTMTNIQSRIKPKIVKTSEKSIELDDAFVLQYRKMFKNTKIGAMGSPTGVKSKLKRFMDNNPTISKETILEATRRYLDSLTSYNYLQQADYFIYKRDRNGDETSRLEAYVEEVNQNPNFDSDEDWTTNLI